MDTRVLWNIYKIHVAALFRIVAAVSLSSSVHQQDVEKQKIKGRR